MQSSRRQFLRGAAGGAGIGAVSLRNAQAQIFNRKEKVHFGVPDWSLQLGANPDAVALAAAIGFEGVQISFGRKLVDGKLPLDQPGVAEHYVALAKENKVAICGTCVDRLHDNGLKSDPQAVKWVSDSIRLTKAFDSKVLLLPFFGKWAMTTDDEKNHVGDALKELGPEAEKAGVILGLEDTISAEDNVRIMDRSKSKAVKVYYDVGNSTQNGFDPVKEIRWLGKERVCQFHVKDNPNFLGEGDIDFMPIMHTIRDEGFTGFANLECDVHSNAVEADMRRNLLFIKDALKRA
jgi:L-ribulose-5-phosphate 3-epimerase